MNMHRYAAIASLASAVALVAAGCSGDSAEREREIREQAAKAAAEAKPKIEEAGREIKAAVDGAKEGWEKGKTNQLDLNSASEDELTGLPGIDKRQARRIIAGRPYHDSHELVSRKIVSVTEYDRVKDAVTAN